MKRMQALLVLPALLFCAVPAQAQLFFKKRGPVPAQRVPELILILKTETDERKRAAAAEELRDYDPKTFTEIVPVLVDILTNDVNFVDLTGSPYSFGFAQQLQAPAQPQMRT